MFNGYLLAYSGLAARSGCHKPLAVVQMPPVPPVGCHHAQYNFAVGAHIVSSPLAPSLLIILILPHFSRPQNPASSFSRRPHTHGAGVKSYDRDFMAFLQSAASHLLYLALRLETGSFPKPLSAKEEQAAFAAMRAGDAAARETLICHNLRLVAHIVKSIIPFPAGRMILSALAPSA